MVEEWCKTEISASNPHTGIGCNYLSKITEPFLIYFFSMFSFFLDFVLKFKHPKQPGNNLSTGTLLKCIDFIYIVV